LSFTNSKLDSSLDAYRAGDRMPNIPKITASLNGRYTYGVSANWEGYVDATLTYMGKRYRYDFVPPADRELVKLDDFARFDFRVGAANGDVDVGLFVRNAFDVRGEIGRDNRLGYTRNLYVTPRTIGLSLKADF
jgi:hypothetical protein